MKLTFLSCFSGIEAASTAWLPLGWECLGVAEREPAPCAVLAHHYPDVPNLGDVTADDFLQRASALRPDVLVGGPPCQDFSVAGLRAGIYGDRGNLTLRWVQIIHAVRPHFTLTENVPGWLSANGGHAFGAFLAALVGHDTALVPPKDCGGRWSDAGMVDGPEGRCAWRILDAQHFGLAQRRRRVFVVFCPRGGADPAAILFESKSVLGNYPAGIGAGEDAAGAVGECVGGSGEMISMYLTAHPNRLDAESQTLITTSSGVSPSLRARANSSNRTDSMAFVAHTLRGEGFDASEDGTGRGTPLVAVSVAMRGREGGGMIEVGDEKAFTLRASTGGGDKPHVLASAYRTTGNSGVYSTGDRIDTLTTGTDPNSHVLAFAQNQRNEVRTMSIVGALAAEPGMKQQTYVQTQSAVRRLTPVECEKLQGFPRDYTLAPHRGKPMADGNRYKMLGNSMAVPCIAWLGRRIALKASK